MIHMIDTKRLVKVVPTVTRAHDKFSRYGPIQSHEVRDIKVAESETLKKLKAAWQTYELQVDVKDNLVNFNSNYERSLSILKDLEYSAKDVELFSIALAEFQDENYFAQKAGLFLSALINAGRESDYVIHTTHLQKELSDLCYRNEKNVIVKGNVGVDFGTESVKGSMIVDGNAHLLVGHLMNSGKITVRGNSKGWVGQSMRSGTIIINGDGGDFVGAEMKDGKIIIRGNANGAVGNRMENGEIKVYGNGGNMVGWAMKGGLIRIKGNVTEELAYCMYGGQVIVEGDAGYKSGKGMRNGIVIIKGNAGDRLGSDMIGGTIILHGNAGYGIGFNMHGGELHLNGEFRSFAAGGYKPKGRIYNKGTALL